MKRLVLLLLAMSAGCFGPDDIFIVDGRVTSPEPAEQVVRLLRGKPDQQGTGICGELKPFKDAITNADGGFVFEVFRAQAQSLTGFTTNFCFRVEAQFASGSRATTVVPQLFGPQTLPDLPDWRPLMQLDAGVVAFAPLSPLPEVEGFEGTQLTHRLEARTADGGLAWRADDRVMAFGERTPQRVPLRFDEAVLAEDEAVTVRLRARLTAPVDEAPGGPGPGPGEPRRSFAPVVEAEAGEALVVAGRAAPPSRGLSCAPLPAPCALTDGELTPVELGEGVTTVVLDLPTPLAVRWVVLRGLETTAGILAVQLGTADGGVAPFVQQVLPQSLWLPVTEVVHVPLPDGGVLGLGEPEPIFVAVPLPAGEPAWRVQVSVPGGVRRLAEVSVLE